MNRAVFLDRDGTINVDKHYLYRIEDFEFLPGAVEGMRLLKDAGYLLIVITNQSGIARGYYTEVDFARLNDWMLDALAARGVCLDGVYHCPHLPDAKAAEFRTVCNCRKPATGLFDRAIGEHGIDPAQSWAVGDKLRDCSICKTTPCRGILVGDNERAEILASVENGKKRNIRRAADLLGAAKIIIEETSI